MLKVSGTYENGVVHLDQIIKTTSKIDVVVTFPDFLDSGQKKLSINDFSFLKTREKTKDIKSQFSDVILQDRKSKR